MIARAIEDLLRTIPERWSDFESDDLSSLEQRALFLLVAAGLVERRLGVRAEFAGHCSSVEFTIDVTGEYGLMQAMEPVAAEMWTRWGPAYDEWRNSDAQDSHPFRFIRAKPDRWRLTECGVLALKDLDVESPSPEQAMSLDCHQRVLEFVTQTGHQANRPVVKGEGRLVELKSSNDQDRSEHLPTSVSIANSHELAEAFGKAFVPGLIEALQGSSSSDRGAPTHSIDFTSVDWFGTRYAFSKGNQAQAVRVLWESWEKGGHSLTQETIREQIGSSADRFEMRTTFRTRDPQTNKYHSHPAWQTMIQEDVKGAYRLVEPEIPDIRK